MTLLQTWKRPLIWLATMPWWLLIAVALLMAVVPLGESHLLQKWRMLFSGTLRKPLDWFDLLFHTAPLMLILMKAMLAVRPRS